MQNSPTQIPVIKVAEAVSAYLSKQIVHDETMRAYNVALNKLKTFCGNYHNDFCTTNAIRSFLEKTGQAYASIYKKVGNQQYYP